MTTSPSAMMDGLATLLSAASVFGPSMVGKGVYDVLEIASGSCAVVTPVGLESLADAMGDGQRTRRTTLLIENFYRDTGDGVSFKNKAMQGMHVVTSALESSRTLAGVLDTQVAQIGKVEGKLTPGQVISVDEIIWVPYPVTVEIEEYI